MKASAVITERLRALGYEVVGPPKRNMYYLNSGWRSAGTCCWMAVVKKDGIRHDLLCWWPMSHAAKTEHWDISYGAYSMGFELWFE